VRIKGVRRTNINWGKQGATNGGRGLLGKLGKRIRGKVHGNKEKFQKLKENEVGSLGAVRVLKGTLVQAREAGDQNYTR